MILCLGANDMLSGIDPKLYQNKTSITMIEKMIQNGTKVILAGMRSPEKYG